MAHVLIIDDDKLICDWIANVVTRLGHHPVSAQFLREGLKKLQSESFDIVFVDVRLPDGSGLESMPKIKSTLSSPEIIVITGLGHPDEAELAIKSGAWDYLEKPASFDAIKIPLLRALEYRAERRPGNPSVGLKRDGIIGNSSKITSCLEHRRPGREQRCQCPHHRRNRHRKRAFCQGDPCEQPKGHKKLCGR